jgi:3-oxoacyl-[acyl-carrier-protein] synthase II
MSSNSAIPARVVVTGLGAVSAAGWGVPALNDALRSGRTCIGPFDRFDNASQRTHIAGQVPAGPAREKRPKAPWGGLSYSDRFALFASMEAVAHAGFAQLDACTTGLFFGGTTAGLFETEVYFEALLRQATDMPRRGLLASHTLGAPAEAVARHFLLEGPVETVSSACASGGLALEQALRALRTGEVDVALAGGADALCITTYSGFNALRAVDEQPCRPFRQERAGMSLGEGAAVLVLESLEHARARGAQPLAELLGAGSSCDAHHMTAPHAQGIGAALAIERALADAGIGPDDVDLVNSHGTGTPVNDVAELAALQRVFGERVAQLPLEATKAILGHLLGAAGAIEAVAVVLGLLAQEQRPTPAAGPMDPALQAGLIFDAPRPLPGLRTALSASLGFGGANAAVILARWQSA